MSLQQQVDVPAWAAAVAHAIAREEARDPRNHRLLETGPSSTWNQFRGRLGAADLLAFLAQNAATTQPVPFDPVRVLGMRDAFGRLQVDAAEKLVNDARAQPSDLPAQDYLVAQARRLGVQTLFAAPTCTW